VSMAPGGGENPIQVGISLVPATERLDRIRELVRVADAAGLDAVGIQDHPYQHHFLDTWSLIPTLIAETSRISFFTDVANLPLRPPAVMAKAAASLDVLSGGRFELGLGAGGLPDVIANFGGPRRTPGESVEALDEAIDVIRLLWSDERSVSFEGKYYRLNDARPGPQPAHPIGIWVGAFKPRMIRLVGRKADGWLPSLGVLTRDEMRAGNEQIDAAAEKAGRDPGSIRRILNLHGVIGEGPVPSRSELPVGYLAGEPLAGSPDWWVETLGGYVDDGFDTLVFWPVDPVPEQVELLAGEVATQLRRPTPDQPRLIIELPGGGAVDRQLSAQGLQSVASGDVVVEVGPTDAQGNLEAAAAGQVVLSVPSPEALEREAAEVRRVIAQAGTSVEPLVLVVEAAEELREEELAAVLDAAGHTSRAVILRIIRDA
jgi:alkanesulfonate monooxygenase SsuD/methylene tetrahydromethanopterin reductase-like flavin-dependent oxidoreductase (luciferase family)